MLNNETIDTNPFFTMLSEWMLRDTLENVGKKKKPKSNESTTQHSRPDETDGGTDQGNSIENL